MVLDEIVHQKRMPVLFVGAGLSKRYLKNYLSWNQLLDEVRQKIGIEDTVYAAKKMLIQREYDNLSPGKLNQKIASFLQKTLLDKISDAEIDLKSIFSEDEIRRCVSEEIDFFKLLVSNFFLSYEIKEEKEHELELLQEVCGKISMVFTTNYDDFLEKCVFKNFVVYDYHDEYYFRNNFGYGELYKMHGSAKNPNSIVFCEKDYDGFYSSLRLVSYKLVNALLDAPIIFLGYSLEDENIKAIMADFINCFDQDVINRIKRNMVMIEYEQGQNALIEGEKQFVDEKSGRNITLTTIKTDNFTEIYDYINKLTPSASPHELRKYSSMVYRLIEREEMGDRVVYVQDIGEAAESVEALYIGSKGAAALAGKSCEIFSNEELIGMCLHDTAFDYDLFAFKWYQSKGVSKIQYTPCFLIKAKLTIPYEKTCEKFKANCKYQESQFKKLKSVEDPLSEEKILALFRKLRSSSREQNSVITSVCNKLFDGLRSDSITTNQTKEILLMLCNEYQNAESNSVFKKAACYMWYKIYSK